MSDGRDLLRFGLVGAGAIARTYEQVFSGLGGAVIAAVADVEPLAARSFGERVGCTPYSSASAMLEGEALDAVLVSTPPSTHSDISLEAIAHGCHVLCEKPIALSTPSAETILAAADAAGVLVTMGAKFRYVEDVIRARSIISSGVLGDLVLFENVFASRVDMTRRWNAIPEISGGGVLIDNGTHSVDIIRYFLGPITEVLALEGKRVQRLGVEDSAEVFLKTADGVLGTIDLSWSIDKATEYYISVYGAQGTIQVGWRESRFRQTGSSEWVVFGTGYDKVTCMRAQVRNFCGAIRGIEPLVITDKDALASVGVIEAIYTSLRRGTWVPVTGAAAASDDARVA